MSGILNYYDDLESLAIQALFDANAVCGCPNHEGVIISNGDPDAEKMAYAIATNLLKKEGSYSPGVREDLMEMVKSQLEEAEDECPQCDGMLDD